MDVGRILIQVVLASWKSQVKFGKVERREPEWMLVVSYSSSVGFFGKARLSFSSLHRTTSDFPNAY